MTKIVLADTQMLPAPHELDLASWRELGAEIREAHCETEDDLIRECHAARVIVYFGNNLPLTERVLAALPHCGLIQRVAVGYDSVDVAAATKRGILVANSAGYCDEDVANHALALLLACHQQLPLHHHRLLDGYWGQILDPPTQRLSLQTVGIVGLGRIGQSLCRRVLPLVKRVLAYDPYLSPESARGVGAELVEWEPLLRQSDLISLHCPLTSETRGMIDAEAISKMKPTACLVNTARGPVVDLSALSDAIQDRRLRGAGLDVFPIEPPNQPWDPIFTLPNVIVTPHMASASPASRLDLWRIASESVASVIQGQTPSTIVNPEVISRHWPTAKTSNE